MKKSLIALFLVLFVCQINLSFANDLKSKPNIIVIMSDDIGFSDIGCYGGEVETPNLDYLADNGVRFSQFYNTARCCPSRAALLTGKYPHQAGVGYMTRALGTTKAYQGHLREDVKTIGEYMKNQGYITMHVGKWHVGNLKNQVLPDKRGFDKTWTRIQRVNYWNFDHVYENGDFREVTGDEKKYLTDIEGDKAIEYIEEATQNDPPFFMYLAFDAAHWPLHAKKEDIQKYKNRFNNGWDQLRKERIKRIDSLGLVSYKKPEEIKNSLVPRWDSIPTGDINKGYHSFESGLQDQSDWNRKMEVYAAQIDCMDQNIGRIIKVLKQKGIFENTMIIYVQDNGGCAELIGKHEGVAPGGPDSYASYNLPWAYLSNTPFRRYKHFLYEGGISTPCIIHWPKSIPLKRNGVVENESYGHLIDILPTCLDAAGADVESLKSELEGQSLLPEIKGYGENANRTVFWEHEGNRAIRKGPWKLISRYSKDVGYFKRWGYPVPPREQVWELYNVVDDRWEQEELSINYPDLVDSLINEYKGWAQKVGAIPREELVEGL
ncbi:arylsulfatase [Marinilabilia rubra]|uniref:Arylsulfatase n=1 Tax=Marinilabilia rubra TaxID=2162893 RepID=A0A2U2B623_9BACT|nr:arylsulfatase [Marinilabilia rubra]PWD98517.1 arylsulfatase [Marinilabilia rubra]